MGFFSAGFPGPTATENGNFFSTLVKPYASAFESRIGRANAMYTRYVTFQRERKSDLENFASSFVEQNCIYNYVLNKFESRKHAMNFASC